MGFLLSLISDQILLSSRAQQIASVKGQIINIFVSQLHACMRSHFSRVRLCEILWTVAARLLCPWDSPDKNIGVGYHTLYVTLQREYMHKWTWLCFSRNLQKWVANQITTSGWSLSVSALVFHGVYHRPPLNYVHLRSQILPTARIKIPWGQE